MQLPVEHLMVPCTNRKASQAKIRLRDYVDAKDWKRAIDREAKIFAARNLYMGTAWSRCIRAIEDIVPQRTWVASAGLGLINIEDRVPSYSATFQSDHSDSITGWGMSNADACQHWWVAMSGKQWWRRLSGQGITVIQLSGSYAKALEPGLIELGKVINERLMIISPSLVGRNSSLDPYLLPVDTRIEYIVPTTRGDAGATALAWLASNYRIHKSWDPISIREYCANSMNAQSPIQQWKRKRLDDREVIRFIRNECSKGSRISASVILRRLRDAGFACEQGRIRRLFDETVTHV